MLTYKWLNTGNVKLSDSLLNKLKSAVKNQTGVTLRIDIKMFNKTIYLRNYY